MGGAVGAAGARGAAGCTADCRGGGRGRAVGLQRVGPGRWQGFRFDAQLGAVRAAAALDLPLRCFQHRVAEPGQRCAALHVDRRIGAAAGLPACLRLLHAGAAHAQAGGVQLAVGADVGPAPAHMCARADGTGQGGCTAGRLHQSPQRREPAQLGRGQAQGPAVGCCGGCGNRAAARGDRQAAAGVEAVACSVELQHGVQRAAGGAAQGGVAADRHAGQHTARDVQRRLALQRGQPVVERQRAVEHRRGQQQVEVALGVETVRAFAPRRILWPRPPGQRVEIDQRRLAFHAPRRAVVAALHRARGRCAGTARRRDELAQLDALRGGANVERELHGAGRAAAQ